MQHRLNTLRAYKATLITYIIMLKSPFLMPYNLTVELCSSALSFLFQFVHPAVPVGVLVFVVVTVVRVLHLSLIHI